MHSNSPDKTQSCISPTQPRLQPENEGDASGLQISTWFKHMCLHVDHTVSVPVPTGLVSREMVLVPGLVVGSWGHPVLVVLVPATVVVVLQ